MSSSTQVVCPSCGQINRIPENKPAEKGKCGACKSPLFTQSPVEVDAAGLQRQIQKSEVPLVVDFWAPWCGPCQMMAPAFQQAAARLEPRARLLKVNTEQNPQAAGPFGIRGIPTTILFKNGSEVARTTGALDLNRLVQFVESHL